MNKYCNVKSWSWTWWAKLGVRVFHFLPSLTVNMKETNKGDKKVAASTILKISKSEKLECCSALWSLLLQRLFLPSFKVAVRVTGVIRKGSLSNCPTNSCILFQPIRCTTYNSKRAKNKFLKRTSLVSNFVSILFSCYLCLSCSLIEPQPLPSSRVAQCKCRSRVAQWTVSGATVM